MKSYREAGVDTVLGLKASKLFFQIARETWDKWPWKKYFTIEGEFDGICYINPIKNSGCSLLCGLSLDGVGTKLEIAESLNKYDTIAYDLLAMVCDDCAVRGAVPVAVGTILDLASLTGDEGSDFFPQLQQLADGLLEASIKAGIAVIGGEIAELGSKIGGNFDFKFNWGGTALWFAPQEKLFTSVDLKPGISIIALREYGFRSNGLTLARRVFAEVLGREWYLYPWEGGTLGEACLTPSQIYCRFVNWLNGDLFDPPRASIVGAVNVTGGGFIGRLERILFPVGFGARIDLLPPVPPVIEYCQHLGNIDSYEAYRTWNMGCGIFLFSPEPEVIISLAGDWGLEASIVGRIISTPRIEIDSIYFS